MEVIILALSSAVDDTYAARGERERERECWSSHPISAWRHSHGWRVLTHQSRCRVHLKGNNSFGIPHATVRMLHRRAHCRQASTHKCAPSRHCCSLFSRVAHCLSVANLCSSGTVNCGNTAIQLIVGNPSEGHV